MKNNLLLVDLNDVKTKKLAETITSDTSRKILNFLAEKEHDTEANIAKELNVPISTVHYHLQRLVDASLILVEEFHYSQKGREMNHYKLANKYIIIAPKNVSGLREKLKGILPVGLVLLGISGVIKIVQEISNKSLPLIAETVHSGALIESAKDTVIEETMMQAAPVTEIAVRKSIPVISNQPDIALWFLLGSVVTISVYLLFALVKEHWKKE